MNFKQFFAKPEPRSRKYNILNEIFGAITHGIGVGLAIAGLVILVVVAAKTHDAMRITTYAIYGTSLVLLYLSSTLYHSLVFTRAKHVFQIFDHSAIFILIAGSYTPYTLVGIGGARGWIMFSVIWLLAILGILYKIFNVGKKTIFETILYVLMGWMVLLSAGPLYQSLGHTGFWLLVWGGIAYTFGALLYIMKNIPFIHVIWHVFVMLGSGLMYFSILLYL